MNNGNTLLNLTNFSPLYADDLQYLSDISGKLSVSLDCDIPKGEVSKFIPTNVIRNFIITGS